MSENEATTSDGAKKKTSLMAIIDNLRSKPEHCISTKGPSMIYLRNISKVPEVNQTVERNVTVNKKDSGSKEPQPPSSGAELPSAPITQPVPPSVKSKKAINTEESIRNVELRNSEEDKDTLSNILDFIYEAASLGRGHQNTAHNGQEELGDVAQLEMQIGGKTGVMILVECLANGTAEVKNIIKNDLDLIYECKRCRGMFRALPNFIRHKKDFCKGNGLYSKFMKQPSISTEAQDNAFKQLLRTLQKPEMTAVPIQLDDMPSTSQAVQQKAINSIRVSSHERAFSSNKLHIPASTAQTKYSLVDSAEAMTYVNENRPLVSKMLIKNNGNFTSFSKLPGEIGYEIQSRSTPKNSFVPMQHPSYKMNLCQMKAKPSCPLCHKEMAERKNVRRHLVRVHMLSVVDALKLMHSKSPSVAAARAIADSDRSENPNSLALRRKCIDSLVLGNNRKIYVLPPSYEVAKTGCPVCSRILCNKTNVRRHLLETHNFVIKGDKKYHQLKVYAKYNKADIVTTSLRNLRTISTIPSFEETVGDSSNFSKISFDDSSVDDEEDKSVDRLEEEIKKVKPNDSNETTIREDNEGKEDNRFAPVEDLIQIDPVTLTCLSCDKSFSRRQTLKKHMITIHHWNKDHFNSSIYDKATMPDKNEVESEADNEEDLSKDVSNYSRRKFEPSAEEPSAKKPRMLEVTIKREAIKNIEMKTTAETSVASQKLMAISKLAAAEGGKKINVGCISIPLVQSCNGQSTSSSSSSSSNTSYTNSKLSVMISQNGPTASSNSNQKDNFSKHLLLQRMVTLPSTTIVSSPSTSSGVLGKLHPRPFIQIKLEQTVKAKSKPNTETPTKLTEDSTTSPRSNNRPFNIAERKCNECDMTFDSQTNLKRHLLEIHSFTIEDVMGASYDSAEVSDEAQEKGIALGFDILNAKCLICNKYYFSRENLSKHMSKIHHLLQNDLNDLKKAAKFRHTEPPLDKNEKNSVKNVDTVTTFPTKDTTPVPNNDKKTQITTRKSPRTPQPPQSPPTSEVGVEKYMNSFLLKTDSGNKKTLTPEAVASALDIFPKSGINPQTMKCLRCKNKFRKVWDLKVHLLKHLRFGIFFCKFCRGHKQVVASRATEMFSHFNKKHSKAVGNKAKAELLTECRIDNKPLWEAYGLPLGRY